MNYSDEYQMIFILPPRQGTRSISAILEYLNFKSNGNNPNRMVHDIGVPEGKEKYNVVCTIRNPYRRYLSFKNMVAEWKKGNHPQFKDKDLNLFTTQEWWEVLKVWFSSYNQILEVDKKYKVDYFVDTDNLQEDLLQISLFQNKLQDPLFSAEWDQRINTNHFHSPPRTGFIPSINKEEADLIYTECKSIFDRFSYDKNSWNNFNKK